MLVIIKKKKDVLGFFLINRPPNCPKSKYCYSKTIKSSENSKINNLIFILFVGNIVIAMAMLMLGTTYSSEHLYIQTPIFLHS